jgi:hypothetical protein
MANITISIPDAAMQRVEDAFVAQYNYQEVIPEHLGENGEPIPSAPNPETKQQFVKRRLKDHVKDTVALHEGTMASVNASDAARIDLG